MKCLTWTDFKNTCITKKKLCIQFEDLDTQYRIIGPDNSLIWEITLNKLMDDGSANPDVTDFETNYKDGANMPLEYRSTDGLLKVASAMFSDAKSFWVDGTATQANISASSTVYIKKHFTDEFTISGVDARWFGANWGDYLDFEVGFYTNPADETTFQTIQQFADNYKIFQDGNRLFDVPTVKIIPPTATIGGNTFDIYVRVTCVNVGANASKVIINLVGWK